MSQSKKCAYCQKDITPNAEGKMPFFPFCSERCKEIDLGKWFSESYAIPADEPNNTEKLKEIQKITSETPEE